MNKHTKKVRLLTLLGQQYVTPLVALREVRCMSLAQRISEWRAQGYEFHQRTVEADGAPVSAYKLAKAPAL